MILRVIRGLLTLIVAGEGIFSSWSFLGMRIKPDPVKENPMIYDAEFLTAAEAIRLSPPDVASTQGKQNFCSVYAAIRPILQGIVPFLSLIPKIGAQAAAALKALMIGLDNHCGQPTQTFPPAQPPSVIDVALARFDAISPLLGNSQFDLCSIYRDARPILEAILPFLRLIPSIGDVVGAAVTALITILDEICPQ